MLLMRCRLKAEGIVAQIEVEKMAVLIIHCTHYTLYSLYTVLTMHSTHYTLYSLYTIHCTLYTILYTKVEKMANPIAWVLKEFKVSGLQV
jgi:hypothetical protein